MLLRYSQIFLVALIFLLSACSKGPIDSLQKTTFSKRYDHQYWMEQYQHHTSLWKEAFNYCDKIASPKTVNCRMVIFIHETHPQKGIYIV